MAKFIIEVEEGNTKCEQCQFREFGSCKFTINEIDCSKYDLRTLKITKEE